METYSNIQMLPNSTGKLFSGRDHFLCIIYKLPTMSLVFRRIYQYSGFAFHSKFIKDLIKPWNEICIQHTHKQKNSFNIKLFALKQVLHPHCKSWATVKVWKVIQKYGQQNLLISVREGLIAFAAYAINRNTTGAYAQGTKVSALALWRSTDITLISPVHWSFQVNL